MDFAIPKSLQNDLADFNRFIVERVKPNLSKWEKSGKITKSLFRDLGNHGYLGYELKAGTPQEHSALKQALYFESLAAVSPGVAIAVLVQTSLGLKGLRFFGSNTLKDQFLLPGMMGKKLYAVGNTESKAGSDAGNIATVAKKVKGGWRLTGAKSMVTNGMIGDYAIVSAITDPKAAKSRRNSLFWVDLSSKGIARKKLHKDVWIPSDLTRLELKGVFVPEEHLLGKRGRGLSHILKIFTHSRLTISALTIGTAIGAFELALNRAKKRNIFGKKIIDFQAKAFESADLYAKIEAARLLTYKACCVADSGQKNIKLESSMAKYVSVKFAREVCTWAADLFGGISVMENHPVHKFPLGVWASSLGEGTQDVQKLIIFREIIKSK